MQEDIAIRVADLGVHFRRSRRGRRSLKDLFGGSARRARPGEFWALRNPEPSWEYSSMAFSRLAAVGLRERLVGRIR